jgi:FkbM family methyltransferase
MISKTALVLANMLFKLMPAVYRPLYFTFKRKQDAHLLQLMKARISRGDTVLDIGANIGFFTGKLAVLVGERGKVYAFEPDEANFKQLQISTKGSPQAVLNNVAVGDADGEIFLYHSPLLNVDHRTYAAKGSEKKSRVTMIQLDGMDFKGELVKFIKMDIQGFEFQALKGMKNLLMNHRPQIIMEFWPWGLMQAGSKPKEVLEWMEALGYEVLLIIDAQARLEPLNSDKVDRLGVSETRYYNILANPLN